MIAVLEDFLIVSFAHVIGKSSVEFTSLLV